MANRNPPGYRPPIRRDKKAVVLWLEPELVDAAREVTAREGSNLQDTVARFLRDLTKKPAPSNG